ncbi:MAG: D-glycero-beta-D-manno-heptose-7-phosphate kinase, partial [Candidatus Omnitrophica bacterium]|nr:D-glycero-beta-D-manno-heptose-7-phosphate kinase [Candidatus Omnitrophota bacterium]
MNNFAKIVSGFSKKSIMVIGDIMLDRYIQGSVTRISPEAPVPIVLEDRSFYLPGGASNVANNLKSLGVKVSQIGRIGNDLEGGLLKRELKRKGIDISGVFIDNKAPTITKTRVIAQQQQIVRIDRERTAQKPDQKLLEKIFSMIESEIDLYDAVIISDYGKGIVTPDLVSFVCSLSLKKGKIITVDPKV